MPKLDRQGILERIEAEHGGVKTEPVVLIFSWQVQHFWRCPLVFSLKANMPKCDRRGILERIEAKHGGVKTERVVLFSWQAQHFWRCPLVFSLKANMPKLDRQGILERIEAERGVVKTECVVHLGTWIVWWFQGRKSSGSKKDRSIHSESDCHHGSEAVLLGRSCSCDQISKNFLYFHDIRNLFHHVACFGSTYCMFARWCRSMTLSINNVQNQAIANKTEGTKLVHGTGPAVLMTWWFLIFWEDLGKQKGCNFFQTEGHDNWRKSFSKNGKHFDLEEQTHVNVCVCVQIE